MYRKIRKISASPKKMTIYYADGEVLSTDNLNSPVAIAAIASLYGLEDRKPLKQLSISEEKK